MFAISVKSPGKPAIEQDTKTKPVGDEVLMRVLRAGIRSSDIQILKGGLYADPRRLSLTNELQSEF